MREVADLKTAPVLGPGIMRGKTLHFRTSAAMQRRPIVAGDFRADLETRQACHRRSRRSR